MQNLLLQSRSPQTSDVTVAAEQVAGFGLHTSWTQLSPYCFIMDQLKATYVE